VRVTLASAPDDGVVRYEAAAPPDFRSSFTGSGLPFANAEHAFENTPNRGTARVGADRALEVRLRTPNSFYVGLGTVVVPPTLFVSYVTRGEPRREAFQVANGVPFRSLTYPKTRGGSGFYAVPEQLVRSQEAILHAGRYPEENREPHDFWGGRPPV
jgi:hypothetical protein